MLESNLYREDTNTHTHSHLVYILPHTNTQRVHSHALVHFVEQVIPTALRARMPSNLKIQHGVLDSVNNAWGRPDAIIARRRMQLRFPQVLKVPESKREEAQEEKREGNRLGTLLERVWTWSLTLFGSSVTPKSFCFSRSLVPWCWCPVVFSLVGYISCVFSCLLWFPSSGAAFTCPLISLSVSVFNEGFPCGFLWQFGNFVSWLSAWKSRVCHKVTLKNRFNVTWHIGMRQVLLLYDIIFKQDTDTKNKKIADPIAEKQPSHSSSWVTTGLDSDKQTMGTKNLSCIFRWTFW